MKEKSKKSKREIIGVTLVIIGLLLVLVYTIFMIISLNNKHKGEDLLDNVIVDEDDRYVYVSEDFIKKLRELFKNEDIVGYIVFKDADISYPIVQGKNNDEYLRRDISGNYSIGGSIMLDCTRARDFSNLSSVLYGHHMHDGSMFGKLEGSVKDLSKMSSVYVYTEKERLEYKGVSQEILNPYIDDIMYLFTEEKEDFYNYINKIAYDGSLNVKQDSKYLTLITCHYTGIRSKVMRYGLTCEYKEAKKYKVREEKNKNENYIQTR